MRSATSGSDWRPGTATVTTMRGSRAAHRRRIRPGPETAQAARGSASRRASAAGARTRQPARGPPRRWRSVAAGPLGDEAGAVGREQDRVGVARRRRGTSPRRTRPMTTSPIAGSRRPRRADGGRTRSATDTAGGIRRRAGSARTRRRRSGRRGRVSRPAATMASAISASRRSPAWWPMASLTLLNSSRSSMTRLNGSALRDARPRAARGGCRG